MTKADRNEMTLVYPDAVSGGETVSIFAPVGSALLGLPVNPFPGRCRAVVN